MTTTRLDTAIKHYNQVNQMVERYTRLCRAYVRLSERFQELDVAHMTLKKQAVSLLAAYQQEQARHRQQLEENQSLTKALEASKAEHDATVQDLIHTYEARIQALTVELDALLPLQQVVFSEEAQAALSEAESQEELLEETFKEIEADDAPDLTPEEKVLLAEFRANPAHFTQSEVASMPMGSGITSDHHAPSLTH
jgi:phage protein D